MKPGQISSQLRRIAASVDDSHSPDRALVVKDLKRVLVALENPESVEVFINVNEKIYQDHLSDAEGELNECRQILETLKTLSSNGEDLIREIDDKDDKLRKLGELLRVRQDDLLAIKQFLGFTT